MKIFKKKENSCDHGHSPRKHMLHMILCCGIPIIIVFALPFIAGISPAAAGVLGIITPFICPVMMGGMLLMMFSKEKADCCLDKAKPDRETTIK